MDEIKTLSMSANVRDLEIENGDFKQVKGISAYKVICESCIRTCLGELPFNESVGIPYFDTILDKPMWIQTWRSAVIKRLKDLSFVNSITDFETSFNAKESRMDYSLTIVTDLGGIDLRN